MPNKFLRISIYKLLSRNWIEVETLEKEEKKKEKEIEEVEFVEEIEYEKFFDAFAMNKKRGIFALLFGQAIYEPAKLLARIWIDAPAMKMLAEFLQEQVKKYEEEYGKIE